MHGMTLIVNAVNASGVHYYHYIAQFRNNYNDNINIFDDARRANRLDREQAAPIGN